MDQAIEYLGKVSQDPDPELLARLDLLAKHKALVEIDKQVVGYRKGQNKGLISNVDYEAIYQATMPNDTIKRQDARLAQAKRRPPPPKPTQLADLY